MVGARLILVIGPAAGPHRVVIDQAAGNVHCVRVVDPAAVGCGIPADLAVGERHDPRVGDAPSPQVPVLLIIWTPLSVTTPPAGHAVRGDGGSGGRQDAGRGDPAAHVVDAG